MVFCPHFSLYHLRWPWSELVGKFTFDSSFENCIFHLKIWSVLLVPEWSRKANTFAFIKAVTANHQSCSVVIGTLLSQAVTRKRGGPQSLSLKELKVNDQSMLRYIIAFWSLYFMHIFLCICNKRTHGVHRSGPLPFPPGTRVKSVAVLKWCLNVWLRLWFSRAMSSKV